MAYFIFYLTLVNILSFILFGIDKSRAARKKWRIPERTLFFTAVIGGSLGAEAGILCFRHKTKHARFFVGIPAIILIQFLAALYFFN